MDQIIIGQPLEEFIKGSLEYARDAVRRAFDKQFSYLGEKAWRLSIADTFTDFVVVYETEAGEPNEFYRVPYTTDAEGKIVFAAREAWEPVELVYRPVTAGAEMAGESVGGQGHDTDAAQADTVTDGTALPRKPGGGKRLDEEQAGTVRLAEGQGAGGPKRIKAIGITAGVVNGNHRRYAAEVLSAAVADMRRHLHESAGQGRAVYLLGEAEHPESKPSRRPNIRETVVKWDGIEFNAASGQVELDGHLIETAAGRDIQALLEGGVMPALSQRGRGRSHFVEENGERIEEVDELTLTGYDMVMEPSDPFAGVTMAENEEPTEDDMDPEKLAEMIRQHPELFKGVVADEVKTMTEAQRKALEADVRKALGIAEDADLYASLTEAVKAQRELAELKNKQAVATAIAEATKSLPYGEKLNKLFTEAVLEAAPASVEAVTALIAQKRKEYDALVSAKLLLAMGKNVDVVGPVIESETGGNWPAYAQVAHDFTEALIKSGNVRAWQPKAPKNRNEQVAAQMLERFDTVYRDNLAREAQMYAEATTAAGLNLPYGVSRAILGAVWPTLVATGLFDVAPVDQAPVYIYYESYADESNKHVAVTREEVTTDRNDWVSLAYKRLQPGTVVVENHANNVVYTEGTDYIIDYTNGAIMELATIGDTTNCHVSYHYDAVRGGEGAAIQSGKMTLSRTLMDIQADRLATQVNNEAMVFSRSQLGWDATNRTLMSLINEIRRIIDADLMFDALSAALGVSSNSGGTWTIATDPIIDFVSYIGVSKDKIAKRYYEPTGILLSSTRGDAIANWDGFTAAGKRPDADLNANGYIGRLKGLPVFVSTEFSDSYALVFNRQHVFHRVYQPMQLKGPFQTYSSGNLVAAEQWYAEEYNGTAIPVRSKASYVAIA